VRRAALRSSVAAVGGGSRGGVGGGVGAGVGGEAGGGLDGAGGGGGGGGVGGSDQNVNGLGWLSAGFRSAFGEARTLQGRGQALKQPGNDRGHGGVVFGSEMACVAIDLRFDADGNVFDFAHGANSPRAFFSPYW